MREVRQGQFYRHFKDRLYQIVAVAEHSETGERMVVYQALYGDYRVYVRPYEMFVSEVDHEKYPRITQRYRFELVEMTKEKDADVLSTQTGKRPAAADAGPADRKRDAVLPDTGGVNPILLEFLDAETLEEKLHIMIFGRNQMDDNLLNNIAISLDLVVDEKSTQEKYDEILNCLSMMEKFECNRLR